MSKAPDSYRDQQRPPLDDAIRAEGDIPTEDALAILVRKDYFTARPRPWKLGWRDRGLGRGDYGVLDRFGDIVAMIPERSDAELIIAAVNAYEQDKKRE